MPVYLHCREHSHLIPYDCKTRRYRFEIGERVVVIDSPGSTAVTVISGPKHDDRVEPIYRVTLYVVSGDLHHFLWCGGAYCGSGCKVDVKVVAAQNLRPTASTLFLRRMKREKALYDELLRHRHDGGKLVC